MRSKFVALALSSVALVGASLLSAPAASAAVDTPIVTFSGAGLSCSPNVATVTGNPGDSFTVVNACGQDIYLHQFSPALLSFDTALFANGQSKVVTLGSLGSTPLVVRDSVNTNLGLMDVVSTDAVVTASDPAPWLLSYGRTSASASCATGWSASWAEWANGGKGGPVCNRTLYWHKGDWWLSPDAAWISGGDPGAPWDGTTPPVAH